MTSISRLIRNNAIFGAPKRGRNSQREIMMHGVYQSVLSSATGILRAVSPNNRFPNLFISVSPAYQLTYAGRYPVWIGSGDCSELRVLLNNITIDVNNVTSPGNTLTITDVFIESAVNPASVRVTFDGGSNGRTLANGEYDVVSDALLPSAFGLTKFTRGEKYYVRISGYIPNTGTAKMPIMRFADSSECSANYFNPATGNCTNLSGTGSLTWSGTKVFTRGYQPIILGKFISGDPRTWLGIGDSIFDGAGDDLGASQAVGSGYFARAMHTPTPNTSAVGGINFGESSGVAEAWVGSGGGTPRPALFAMTKYCSGAVCEYGTNAFDNAALLNTSQMNYVYNHEPALWAALRANASAVNGASAFKVVRTLLMPRTTTPTDNTPAGQTIYGPKWDVGGNVDDFNARILTAVGTTVDVAYNPASLVRYDPSSAANTNYHKWLNGLANTTDGVHPVGLTHIALAAELAAVLPT